MKQLRFSTNRQASYQNQRKDARLLLFSSFSILFWVAFTQRGESR